MSIYFKTIEESGGGDTFSYRSVYKGAQDYNFVRASANNGNKHYIAGRNFNTGVSQAKAFIVESDLDGQNGALIWQSLAVNVFFEIDIYVDATNAYIVFADSSNNLRLAIVNLSTYTATEQLIGSLISGYAKVTADGTYVYIAYRDSSMTVATVNISTLAITKYTYSEGVVDERSKLLQDGTHLYYTGFMPSLGAIGLAKISKTALATQNVLSIGCGSGFNYIDSSFIYVMEIITTGGVYQFDFWILNKDGTTSLTYTAFIGVSENPQRGSLYVYNDYFYFAKAQFFAVNIYTGKVSTGSELTEETIYTGDSNNDPVNAFTTGILENIYVGFGEFSNATGLESSSLLYTEAGTEEVWKRV